MQSPEDFLYERFRGQSYTDAEGIQPQTSSSISHAFFIIGGFVAVAAAIFVAGPALKASDDIKAPAPVDELSADSLTEEQLLAEIETVVRSGDPKIAAGMSSIQTVPDTIARATIDRQKDLTSLARSLHSDLNSLEQASLALESLQNSWTSCKSDLLQIENTYLEKKSELERQSPLLMTNVDSLKEKEKLLQDITTELKLGQERESDLALQLKASQKRATDLGKQAQTAHVLWREQIDGPVQRTKEDLEQAEGRFNRQTEQAKTNGARIGTLDFEVQTHSKILTESTTKMAELSHQKQLLESRLKAIQKLGHDLNKGVGSNEDILADAISKQKADVGVVHVEYSAMPEHDPAEDDHNETIDTDEVGNVKGYRKRMMQITVDQAERKLAWLQELEAISKQHVDKATISNHPLNQGALKAFIDLKKSELINGLTDLDTGINRQRKFQERVVLQMSRKNSQLHDLEVESSEDAIDQLRQSVDRARSASESAVVEAASRENAHLIAQQAFELVEAESVEFSEKLSMQSKQVSDSSTKHVALAEEVDTLRKGISVLIRLNRAVMNDIFQTRTQFDRLMEVCAGVARRSHDAFNLYTKSESAVRCSLEPICSSISKCSA